MTKARSNAVANAAKGDLTVGNGTNLSGILAVGNNGESLVADSSATTGLSWQPNYAAGKNKIINGDFGIWQRGTSFSNPSSDAYLADRFRLGYDGTGATRTVTQQTFTPGTAPVAGYEGTFFFRCATTVAGSGNTLLWLRQSIEDVRQFAGQSVTVSFWAKADSARTLPIVGCEQAFGSGGSASVYVDGSSINITTSWVRYSQTLSIPSIAGKTIGTNSSLTLYIKFPVGVATIDIWGVQLEAGSTASPFQTATGTKQGELAACQRYYYRQNGTTNTPFGFGMAGSTTSFRLSLPYKQPMRVAPSSLDFSALQVVDTVGGYAVSNLVITAAGTDFADLTATSTGMTAQRAGWINGTGTCYIGLSAEL